MKDFWRLVIRDDYSAVRQPAIDANNFELKPDLITMVQQHQYTSHPSEGPIEHMGRFMRMENTIKLNGVRPEVIKLQLFPFSLRDVATTWFESMPYGSVDNWEDLGEASMSIFVVSHKKPYCFIILLYSILCHYFFSFFIIILFVMLLVLGDRNIDK